LSEEIEETVGNGNTWEDRYRALVGEKYAPDEAGELIELIEEDPAAFMNALAGARPRHDLDGSKSVGMSQPDEQSGIRPCGCTGCGAPHHKTGAVAKARWYFDSSVKREEVCGTCANRRTTSVTRSQYLTPIAGERSTSIRLIGKMVAGLEISGVSAEEGVVCECSDHDCVCRGTCMRPAIYLWGGVDHDDWQYLCRLCCVRLVERGAAPGRAEEKTNAG
jgi:hypothetical protein